MYNLEEVKKALVCKLHEFGYLESMEKIERVTPGHGPCCTCQTCGRHYDDCVCESNNILEIIAEAFKVK